MACCGRSETAKTITVRFPDGTEKSYATRVDAVAAITRAGGGVISGG